MEKINVLEILFEESEEEYPETSSSEEDEFPVLVARLQGNCSAEIIQRKKEYIYRDIPGFSAETFKTHFRMFPATFEEILRMIGPQLHKEEKFAGRKQIPPREQLLITIWVMATPDSYRSVCEKFDIAKSTAIRAVQRCTDALYCLAPKIITWPKGNHAQNVITNFERFSGFPKVIGAIDGTHVKVDAPAHVKNELINRKGYASVQMQAVCQHDCIFTSVFAGYAGSVHDARVFRLSPVKTYLGDPEYFPDGSHLVGDAAYGIHPNIMVPFKDNGHLTLRQNNYNLCLSSARMSIERAFGLWKARWRRVKDCLHMIKAEYIPKFLLATCVLHNICILKSDFIQPTTNLRVMRRGHLTQTNYRSEGNAKRQEIAENLIIRNN